VTYIAPQIGSQQEPVDPHGAQPAAAGKYSYIETEKERFRKDAAFHLAYRKRLESAMNKMFPLFLRGTEINLAAKNGMRESMEKRIGPGHDDLKKNLIPSWSPGCRRLRVSLSLLCRYTFLLIRYCGGSREKITWKRLS
jgi:hypothetical protein